MKTGRPRIHKAYRDYIKTQNKDSGIFGQRLQDQMAIEFARHQHQLGAIPSLSTIYRELKFPSPSYSQFDTVAANARRAADHLVSAARAMSDLADEFEGSRSQANRSWAQTLNPFAKKNSAL